MSGNGKIDHSRVLTFEDYSAAGVVRQAEIKEIQKSGKFGVILYRPPSIGVVIRFMNCETLNDQLAVGMDILADILVNESGQRIMTAEQVQLNVPGEYILPIVFSVTKMMRGGEESSPLVQIEEKTKEETVEDRETDTSSISTN